MNIRTIAGGALLILLCGAIAPLSKATSIVAPNANQNVEGDSNNIAPFSAGLFGTSPAQRYEQVYAASQFSSVGPTFDITSIAFRLDGNDAPGSTSDTYPNIRIDLSTTSFGPNALSSTFADNIGADDVVVYSGSLTLSGSGGTSPNPFNLVINLQTPFLYTPSLGNLLLDIEINAGGNGFMPALDATADSPYTSRLRDFNDVTSPTGTADPYGLVTQFSSGVPEPSALVLCGCGIVLLGAGRLLQRVSKPGVLSGSRSAR